MRPTTFVHVGFKNVGDSQAETLLHAAPLKDALLWLVSQIGQTTMAQRFDIVMGRNQVEVERGLANNRTGKAKVTESMSKMLDNMMAGIEWVDDEDSSVTADVPDSPMRQVATSRVEGDDYES